MRPTGLSYDAGLIGLLMFFSFFVGILFWLFRPGAKPGYDADARIPLREDANHE